MKISIDISYYPLNEEYVTPILDFIARMNRDFGFALFKGRITNS